MTEEQKAKFCDDFCKYRSKLDSISKAHKASPYDTLYAAMVISTQKWLDEWCDNCPLNEVSDE